MQEAGRKLLSLLMPEGLLEYFQILEVDQVDHHLHIYLDELNIATAGYENIKLESKGFIPSAQISLSGDIGLRYISVVVGPFQTPERLSQGIGA